MLRRRFQNCQRVAPIDTAFPRGLLIVIASIVTFLLVMLRTPRRS
jgi:hypothetical protein